MSNRQDSFHPFTEKLYNSRDPLYKERPLGRTANFYDSEVKVDWSNCDIPQPNDSDTFANNPQWLKDHDRRDFRHRRVEQILKDVCCRNEDEEFDIFIERAYSKANLALKAHNKNTYEDDYPELVDIWVFRFVKGFKLVSSLTGKRWDPRDEIMLTKLIREECDILSKQDEVFVDPHNKVRNVKRAWEKVPEDNYPSGSKS